MDFLLSNMSLKAPKVLSHLSYSPPITVRNCSDYPLKYCPILSNSPAQISRKRPPTHPLRQHSSRSGLAPVPLSNNPRCSTRPPHSWRHACMHTMHMFRPTEEECRTSD